jgi:RuvB-like protein 1 (pontin 52)
MISPHGIPVDLLDRLLIIKTASYGLEELMKILAIRASTESIKLTPEALAYLGEVGSNTSLRYCVQLLTPSWVVANTKGKTEISKEEIEDVAGLFYDAKRSARHLQENAHGYIS